MGYVKNPEGLSPEFIMGGRYEVNVSGRRVAATPHLRPPFDPDRKKVLA
jgi:4-methylaminobutanoate oxidase (formaldehyde-forming)